MKLTVKEFFDKFPIVQGDFARELGIKKVAFTGIKQGASMSKIELKRLNSLVKLLATELAKVEIIHENIHSEGARRSNPQRLRIGADQ